MSSVNKVIIVGRLGADPEVKTIGGGQTVASLRVATSESWVKDGQKQEKTEWHRINVWGKQAENCGRYLAKGKLVYVEGRLQTRSWEDASGQKKFSTEIIASTIQFLSPASGEKSSNTNSSASYGSNFGSSNNASDFQFQDFGQEPSFDASEEIPF